MYNQAFAIHPIGAMTQSVHHPNGNPLPCFKLKQGEELITDHAGLALVGSALAKFARVRETLDKALPKRSGLSVGEIVTAYVGLLCTGKSDFDAIENHRQDGFFVEALGLGAVPAASTLRMQLNAQAERTWRRPPQSMNVAVSVPSPPAPPPEGEGSVVSRLRDFHDNGCCR